MKASTCLNIVFSRSDIVETCSSSPIVFPRRSFFAKTLGTAPKSWLPDCLLKMQLLTHPLLTQGCLRHTLNEYFSQLIPNQDDLLILKTHFLSQDWIHWKHKYFLFEDLRNQPFLHTLISVECVGWVEMKGRKRRCYRWEIKNAIIPPICRPTEVSLSFSFSLFFFKCVCTSSCDCSSHLPLVLHPRMA
jgi:hypothetical protein